MVELLPCMPRLNFYIVEPMTPPASLGEFEQMVLLTVLRLREGAYGMAVRRELESRARREVAIGAVYATLDRMLVKGLVRAIDRPGEAARDARPRKCFEVTAAGRRALRHAHDTVARMTEGLEGELGLS